MTSTLSNDHGLAIVAERQAVIAESGWGAGFRIIQTRNLAFWIGALTFVAGASRTLPFLSGAAQAYRESFTQGVVWFGLFGLAYLWFFSRLDRYSTLPAKAKVVAFVFTALAASFGIAAETNDAVMSLLLKTAGSEFANTWGASLSAPWSEEIAKLMPVVLLLALAPHVVRTAFDGLIIGAISGLGFQVVEDVIYTFQAAGKNFGQPEFGTQILFVRTIFGLSGHWAWSAVAGAGLIVMLGAPAQQRRRLLGLSMILSSMVLHFLWDSTSGLTGGAAWSSFLYVPMTVVSLLLFFLVYKGTVTTERSWAERLLASEVDSGLISADELTAAFGSRRTRRHHLASQPHRRRSRHVLESIRDLADTIAHADGVDTPAVDHARAEVTRLRG